MSCYIAILKGVEENMYYITYERPLRREQIGENVRTWPLEPTDRTMIEAETTIRSEKENKLECLYK